MAPAYLACLSLATTSAAFVLQHLEHSTKLMRGQSMHSFCPTRMRASESLSASQQICASKCTNWPMASWTASATARPLLLELPAL